MTNKAQKIIDDVRKNVEEIRNKLKKDIDLLVNTGEISYYEALYIFEVSNVFNINSYVLDCPVTRLYDDHILNDYGEKYRTITFIEILDWVNDSEGEVSEALDAAGVDIDPDEILYNYAIVHDTIGYELDW